MDKYVCSYCGECPGCVAKIHELQIINNNLQGHIRRLEKSNQELGEELQRCCNKDSKGWNKNVC